jgi:hypothetical protein
MDNPRPSSQGQLAVSALFAHNRPVVTPVQAAQALAISEQQVGDLIEAGELFAFGISTGTPSRRARQHFRIMRASVEAFWLENYLQQNGWEYPVVNSPEVQVMRAKLRALRSDGRSQRASSGGGKIAPFKAG